MRRILSFFRLVERLVLLNNVNFIFKLKSINQSLQLNVELLLRNQSRNHWTFGKTSKGGKLSRTQVVTYFDPFKIFVYISELYDIIKLITHYPNNSDYINFILYIIYLFNSISLNKIYSNYLI